MLEYIKLLKKNGINSDILCLFKKLLIKAETVDADDETVRKAYFQVRQWLSQNDETTGTKILLVGK